MIFKFADIGEGIHEGKVAEIFKNVGDDVKEGDNLLSVETDKMTAEIPSPYTGKITKLFVKPGQVIHVGADLYEFATSGGAQAATPKAEAHKAPEKVAEKPAEEAASVVGSIKVSNEVLSSSFGSNESSTTSSSSNKLATPLARALAAAKGVNINSIQGTGPNGRVTRDDVLAAGSAPAFDAPRSSSPKGDKPKAPTLLTQDAFFGSSTEKREAPTTIRNAIAKSMKDSQTNVAYTNLVTEINVSRLIALRNDLKDRMLADGIKLSYLPFIVKAIALALENNPKINATYDVKTSEIVYLRNINVGIAVDAPKGLFVPVVRDANKTSIKDIAKEITRLAGLTREGKLGGKDMSGGTFTISNYGSVGALFGNPVIKFPEMAIAGVGAFTKKALVVEGEATNVDILYFTVAGDHRWIDGGDIGRFSMRVRELLESPAQLLL